MNPLHYSLNTSEIQHPAFLSCDWGTSSFRLRLIDTENGEILKETKRDVGVKSIYLQSKKSDGSDRESHFESFLIRESELILESCGYNGVSIILMLSGMTTSSIGWIELPYAKTPFPLDGSKAVVQAKDIETTDGRKIHCRLISGVQTEDEMMRGEETELMGVFSLDAYQSLAKNCLAIVPGTHSKHVLIRDGMIVDIQTYMTGELMDVLGRYSILQANVDLQSVFDQHFRWTLDSQKQSYVDGVSKVEKEGLLGSLFQARTRGVLHDLPTYDNIWFLMGVLIGEEVNQIKKRHADDTPILIAAGQRFKAMYVEAGSYLGMNDRLTFVEENDMQAASTGGQRLLI